MSGVAAARRLAFAEPPGAAAGVMAGGVLALCVALTGPRALSDALFALSAIVWLFLVLAFVGGLALDPARWTRAADVPPALTLVAGTAVLGERVAVLGQYGVAQGVLIVGTVLWLLLLPAVLRHWHTPTTGSSFLVCVSTQALAILAARLARHGGGRWEVYPAGIGWALGLGLYGIALGRFDVRELARGQGDQWVLGGALAISALASTTVLDTVRDVGVLGGLLPALGVAAVVLWWAAVAVYLPLGVSELVWPRWRYDISRWSTVFPLGMFALATLALARTLRQELLWDVGGALTWLAFAAYLVVLAGALRPGR